MRMKLPVRRTGHLRFPEAPPPRERAVGALGDDEGRIEAGLIDSLTLLERIALLEAEFGVDL
jgi:hypothetical protein